MILDNILTKFIKNGRDLVSRNQRFCERTIAKCYWLGDSLFFTLPLIKNGFARTLVEFNPDWTLFAQSTLDRPIPAFVTAIFLAGGYAIYRGYFALGMGSGMLSGGLMVADAIMHQEYYNAVVLSPAIAAGAFAGFYRPLESRFQSSPNLLVRETLGEPKRTSGLILCGVTYPLIATSVIDNTYAVTVSAVSWSIANTLVALMPPERPSSARRNSPDKVSIQQN